MLRLMDDVPYNDEDRRRNSEVGFIALGMILAKIVREWD
jgi:hypothetical protein